MYTVFNVRCSRALRILLAIANSRHAKGKNTFLWKLIYVSDINVQSEGGQEYPGDIGKKKES